MHKSSLSDPLLLVNQVLAASNGVVVASSKVHVDGEEPSEARPSVHSAGADAATALLAIWAPIRRALVVLQLDSSSGALTQIASHALPAKVQVDLDPAAVAFLAGSRLLAVTADGSTLCHAETQGGQRIGAEHCGEVGCGMQAQHMWQRSAA